MTALAAPVAAGQDAAPTQSFQLIAPSFVVEPADDSDGGPQESGRKPDGNQKTVSVKKKGDKLKFHWRSASLDYGKKVRLDFRAKIRGEMRASDAAITKEALD